MPTVYRFYRKCDISLTKENTYSNLPVYAITDNKTLADKFMKQRNMKKMEVVKSKLSKEDTIKYMNANSSAELKEYRYTTHYPDKNEWYAVQMVTTWYERSQVMEASDGTLIEQLNPAACELFESMKEPIVEALYKLQFIQAIAIRQEIYDGDYSDDLPLMTYDELAMLLSYNSDTF